MGNSINVSGISLNNKVNVSSGNKSNSIDTVHNAAWHYAELAKQYAEQAKHTADAIINSIDSTDNITITRNGQNLIIGTKSYVYEQAIASNVWNIQHNLNKKCPKVTLIDTAGTIFYPSVEFIDENNCRIELIGAMAGIAYLE